eukprot:CAMPEP_0195101580 /NCGR_PEP_ID=MMETSP0448-20130528/65199_1 /TAXON_ID=66468 /ORGANISM="Heterocapsa triquestra, Strain CCMP 448" /LENGTH=58 /DNA_ID=CAMNT_0040136917 /DNA_START=23 /DNA_END=197 /DNA_ORIENTATION=-
MSTTAGEKMGFHAQAGGPRSARKHDKTALQWAMPVMSVQGTFKMRFTAPPSGRIRDKS